MGAGLAAILLFVFALELMKSGADGLMPLLRGLLNIEHAADCLGLGWLMACVVLSGSPAAAIAMALLSAETLTQVQTFTMVTGSRLGASFIVLLLGFFYALRGHKRWTVLSTGVLSLLLTASVQLSALPVGIFILKRGWLDAFSSPGLTRLSTGIKVVLNPVTGAATALLPQWALFIVGAGLITLSFQLFDQALPQLRFERAGLHRTSRLIYRPIVMFFLGLLELLHVMSQVALEENAEAADLEAEELMERDAREGIHLEDMLAILRAEGVEAKALVRHGLVVDEIIAEAQYGHFDMLVIGAHTMPGIEGLLSSNLAKQIMLSANRPVLIVRQEQ